MYYWAKVLYKLLNILYKNLDNDCEAISLLNLLNSRKNVEIICALSGGAMCVREIQRAVGGSNTDIYISIEECLKAGLVDDEYVTGWEYLVRQRGTRLIRLTSKGEELTRSLIDSGYTTPLSLPKVRERWIIAVLHALGTVTGKTRLVKLLFLLGQELGFSRSELGSFYKFKPWIYGPFSKEVVKDLEELQDYGIIKVMIRQVLTGEFNEGLEFLHTYELTPEKKQVVQEALANLPTNAVRRLEKLRAFNEMSLKELLKQVYTKYLDYITESTIVERVLNT